MSLVPGVKSPHAFLALLLLILCACEPEPTPLPSVLPTAQPTQGVNADATPAPLRYAVAPYLLAHMTEQDRSLIFASAEIISPESEPISSELGTRYDVIVVPGWLSDGSTVPAPMQVSLLIDATLSPLDDPALADIVRRAVSLPPAVVRLFSPTPLPGTPESTLSATPVAPETLRVELANAGYPDGFDLTLSSPFVSDPGIVEMLTTMLRDAYGIETRLVAPGEPAHLTITTVPTTNAIPLYTLPISYSAVDGLTITFTPSGFPIASR